MVPVAGLEPALLSEQDFESSASTNSTTPAQVWEARNLASETVGSIATLTFSSSAGGFPLTALNPS